LVFTLCYYEELQTSEIALVLGETVIAVLQLHVSALGLLKERLADEKKPTAEAKWDIAIERQ